MQLNINKESNLSNVIGTHTHHSCKPVINLTTGVVYASATDAAEALGTSLDVISRCCCGRAKACKGNELQYVQRTSDNVDALVAQIRCLTAKLTALEADAAVGRAIREAEEAERKAKEDHENALNEAHDAIAKLTARLERRKQIVERKEAECQTAVTRMMETERELADAEMHLLALEGTVKVA